MRAAAVIACLLPAIACAQLSNIRAINRSSVPGLHYDGDTTSVNLSSNARFAAMTTLNPTLLPGDEPGTWDVVVRDRIEKKFFRVSLDQNRQPMALTHASGALVSNDGRTAVFTASTAAGGGTWLWTAATGKGTLLLADAGARAMSKDGRFVVLQVQNGNLASYKVYDNATKTTQSLEAWLGMAGGSASFGALSDNGRLMAVWANRALDPTDARSGWFLIETHRRVAHHLENTDPILGVSADGQYLCVQTDTSYDPRDKGGKDIYRVDVLTGVRTLVSVDALGNAYEANANGAKMSESGTFFAFWKQKYGERVWWHSRKMDSAVSQPLPGATEGGVSISDIGDAAAFTATFTDQFPFDRSPAVDALVQHVRTGERYGLSLGKEPGWFWPESVVKSRDGRYTFISGDDGKFTLHVFDKMTGTTTGVLNFEIEPRSVGSDATGRFVTFLTKDPRLVGSEPNLQVALYDRTDGSARIVSRSREGAFANQPVWYATISPDGNHVAYETQATNLTGGTNGLQPQVFHFSRAANLTRLVARYPDGRPGPWARGGSFSGDSKAIFFSSERNLAPGAEGYSELDFKGRLFRFDIVTRTTIGVPAAEVAGPYAESGHRAGQFTFTDRSGQRVFFNSFFSAADPWVSAHEWNLGNGQVTTLSGLDRSIVGINPSGTHIALSPYNDYGPLRLRIVGTGQEIELVQLDIYGEDFFHHFAMSDGDVAYVRRFDLDSRYVQNAYLANYEFPPKP